MMPSNTGAIAVGGSYNGSLGNLAGNLTVITGGAPDVATFSVNIAGLPLPNGNDNGGAGYTVSEINAVLSGTNVNLNFEENSSVFTAADQVGVDFFNRDATFNRKVAESLQFVGQVAASNYEQADIYSTRLGQSERLMESVSGVSLDEELLDLTRFEKQFAANGKVIQTVNELMDSVLDLVR